MALVDKAFSGYLYKRKMIVNAYDNIYFDNNNNTSKTSMMVAEIWNAQECVQTVSAMP